MLLMLVAKVFVGIGVEMVLLFILVKVMLIARYLLHDFN